MYEKLDKETLMRETRNALEELEVIRNEHPLGIYSDDYLELNVYHDALVREYRNRTEWKDGVVVWKDGDTSPVYLPANSE